MLQNPLNHGKSSLFPRHLDVKRKRPCWCPLLSTTPHRLRNPRAWNVCCSMPRRSRCKTLLDRASTKASVAGSRPVTLHQKVFSSSIPIPDIFFLIVFSPMSPDSPTESGDYNEESERQMLDPMNADGSTDWIWEWHNTGNGAKVYVYSERTIFPFTGLT